MSDLIFCAHETVGKRDEATKYEALSKAYCACFCKYTRPSKGNARYRAASNTWI